jgi:hypothetical protein
MRPPRGVRGHAPDRRERSRLAPARADLVLWRGGLRIHEALTNGSPRARDAPHIEPFDRWTRAASHRGPPLLPQAGAPKKMTCWPRSWSPRRAGRAERLTASAPGRRGRTPPSRSPSAARYARPRCSRSRALPGTTPARAGTVPITSEDDPLEAARRGDEDAFARLPGPHRTALHAHCYRLRERELLAGEPERQRQRGAPQSRPRFPSLMLPWRTRPAREPHSRARAPSPRPCASSRRSSPTSRRGRCPPPRSPVRRRCSSEAMAETRYFVAPMGERCGGGERGSGAGLSSPLCSRARRSFSLRRRSASSARRRSATWRLRRGSPCR